MTPEEIIAEFEALAARFDASADALQTDENWEARAIMQTYWSCAERIRGVADKLRDKP